MTEAFIKTDYVQSRSYVMKMNKIKFFKGIRKYHDTERCLGFSLVYDRSADMNYIFGLTLYLELILWQVWFEVDFLK